MSREIKFRAWNQIDSEYINEINAVMSLDGSHIWWDINDSGDMKYEDDPRNYKLEQYTGLKDKNGKDIYEGDILAWHSNIYRKHDWVGLVLYREAGFAVQESDRSYSSSEWLECACCKDANIIEIVGNVHEDKDLLEEK